MTKATSNGRSAQTPAASVATTAAAASQGEAGTRVAGKGLGGAVALPRPRLTFFEAAPLDRVPPASVFVVTFGDMRIALINTAGVVYATEASCLRCGAGLARGLLQDTRIVCAECGWEYELADGSVKGLASLRLQTYPVRIVHAMIEVSLGTREPP